VTHVPITGYETSAAVFHPGWLPDIEVFPELVELRREFLRLRDQWNEKSARVHEVRDRVEAEKQRRSDALADAYGTVDGEPEQVADQSKELEAELQSAREHSNAAAKAFVAHINRCIATVVEQGPGWIGEIEALDAEHAAEIRRLEEQLLEARRRGSAFPRLRHWIERTAFSGAKMPADHFPFSEIPAPRSGDPKDERERSQRLMLASYAGGMGGSTLISDAESRAREAAAMRGEAPQPALSSLEDDELVDWLMGTGRFDQQVPPAVAEVIAAAGGDPVMADRLLKAEQVANVSAVRKDLVDALSAVTRQGVAA
jgi:hypothetical protein